MTSIDERDVHRTAAEYGIPQGVAEELLRGLRPCIYLVPDWRLPNKEGARPAAWGGGLPSLPQGVEWPAGRESVLQEPLVLTVDCAALPRDVLDIQLPPDGRLLFFTHLSYPPDSSAVLHVPAGVETTERPATYELGGETMEIAVHEPSTFYPVAGLTAADGGKGDTETDAFLDSDEGNDELLKRFEDAVLTSVHGGVSCSGFLQIGGYSNSWQGAPDEGDLVLFAQIQGDAIVRGNPFQNLIVGTREDIAARRYENLEYDQQC